MGTSYSSSALHENENTINITAVNEHNIFNSDFIISYVRQKNVLDSSEKKDESSSKMDLSHYGESLAYLGGYEETQETDRNFLKQLASSLPINISTMSNDTLASSSSSSMSLSYSELFEIRMKLLFLIQRGIEEDRKNIDNSLESNKAKFELSSLKMLSNAFRKGNGAKIPPSIRIGLSFAFSYFRTSFFTNPTEATKMLSDVLNILEDEVFLSLWKDSDSNLESFASSEFFEMIEPLFYLLKTTEEKKEKMLSKSNQDLVAVVLSLLVSLAVLKGSCLSLMRVSSFILKYLSNMPSTPTLPLLDNKVKVYLQHLFLCKAKSTLSAPVALPFGGGTIGGSIRIAQPSIHDKNDNGALDAALLTASARLAVDGTYLYLHSARGLFRIGTGRDNTSVGECYSSAAFDFPDDSNRGWLNYASNYLFYSESSVQTLNQGLSTLALYLVDPLTLKQCGYIFIAPPVHPKDLSAASKEYTPIISDGVNLLVLWNIKSSTNNTEVKSKFPHSHGAKISSYFCIDTYKSVDLVKNSQAKITSPIINCLATKRLFLSQPNSIGYPLKDNSRSVSWSGKGLMIDDQFVFPFACVIHSWGFCARQIGNVTISVWRRSMSNRKWFLVGSNKCLLSIGEQIIPVSDHSQYISVLPGDIVGIEQHSPNVLAVSNKKRGYLRSAEMDQNIDNLKSCQSDGVLFSSKGQYITLSLRAYYDFSGRDADSSFDSIDSYIDFTKTDDHEVEEDAIEVGNDENDFDLLIPQSALSKGSFYCNASTFAVIYPISATIASDNNNKNNNDDKDNSEVVPYNWKCFCLKTGVLISQMQLSLPSGFAATYDVRNNIIWTCSPHVETRTFLNVQPFDNKSHKPLWRNTSSSLDEGEVLNEKENTIINTLSIILSNIARVSESYGLSSLINRKIVEVGDNVKSHYMSPVGALCEATVVAVHGPEGPFDLRYGKDEIEHDVPAAKRILINNLWLTDVFEEAKITRETFQIFEKKPFGIEVCPQILSEINDTISLLLDDSLASVIYSNYSVESINIMIANCLAIAQVHICRLNRLKITDSDSDLKSSFLSFKEILFLVIEKKSEVSYLKSRVCDILVENFSLFYSSKKSKLELLDLFNESFKKRETISFNKSSIPLSIISSIFERFLVEDASLFLKELFDEGLDDREIEKVSNIISSLLDLVTDCASDNIKNKKDSNLVSDISKQNLINSSKCFLLGFQREVLFQVSLQNHRSMSASLKIIHKFTEKVFRVCIKLLRCVLTINIITVDAALKIESYLQDSPLEYLLPFLSLSLSVLYKSRDLCVVFESTTIASLVELLSLVISMLGVEWRRGIDRSTKRIVADALEYSKKNSQWEAESLVLLARICNKTIADSNEILSEKNISDNKVRMSSFEIFSKRPRTSEWFKKLRNVNLNISDECNQTYSRESLIASSILSEIINFNSAAGKLPMNKREIVETCEILGILLPTASEVEIVSQNSPHWLQETLGSLITLGGYVAASWVKGNIPFVNLDSSASSSFSENMLDLDGTSYLPVLLGGLDNRENPPFLMDLIENNESAKDFGAIPATMAVHMQNIARLRSATGLGALSLPCVDRAERAVAAALIKHLGLLPLAQKFMEDYASHYSDKNIIDKKFSPVPPTEFLSVWRMARKARRWMRLKKDELGNLEPLNAKLLYERLSKEIELRSIFLLGIRENKMFENKSENQNPSSPSKTSQTPRAGLSPRQKLALQATKFGRELRKSFRLWSLKQQNRETVMNEFSERSAISDMILSFVTDTTYEIDDLTSTLRMWTHGAESHLRGLQMTTKMLSSCSSISLKIQVINPLGDALKFSEKIIRGLSPSDSAKINEAIEALFGSLLEILRDCCNSFSLEASYKMPLKITGNIPKLLYLWSLAFCKHDASWLNRIGIFTQLRRLLDLSMNSYWNSCVAQATAMSSSALNENNDKKGIGVKPYSMVHLIHAGSQSRLHVRSYTSSQNLDNNDDCYLWKRERQSNGTFTFRRIDTGDSENEYLGLSEHGPAPQQISLCNISNPTIYWLQVEVPSAMVSGGRGGSRISLRPSLEGSGVLSASRTEDGDLYVCTSADEECMLGEEAIIIDIVKDVLGDQDEIESPSIISNLESNNIIWQERLYSAAWTCFRLLASQCIILESPIMPSITKMRNLPSFTGRSYSNDRISSPTTKSLFESRYGLMLPSPVAASSSRGGVNRLRSWSTNASDEGSQKLLQHNSLQIITEELSKVSNNMLHKKISGSFLFNNGPSFEYKYSLVDKHAQRILHLLISVCDLQPVIDMLSQLDSFCSVLRLLHLGNLQVKCLCCKLFKKLLLYQSPIFWNGLFVSCASTQLHPLIAKLDIRDLFVVGKDYSNKLNSNNEESLIFIDFLLWLSVPPFLQSGHLSLIYVSTLEDPNGGSLNSFVGFEEVSPSCVVTCEAVSLLRVLLDGAEWNFHLQKSFSRELISSIDSLKILNQSNKNNNVKSRSNYPQQSTIGNAAAVLNVLGAHVDILHVGSIAIHSNPLGKSVVRIIKHNPTKNTYDVVPFENKLDSTANKQTLPPSSTSSKNRSSVRNSIDTRKGLNKNSISEAPLVKTVSPIELFPISENPVTDEMLLLSDDNLPFFDYILTPVNRQIGFSQSHIHQILRSMALKVLNKALEIAENRHLISSGYAKGDRSYDVVNKLLLSSIAEIPTGVDPLPGVGGFQTTIWKSEVLKSFLHPGKNLAITLVITLGDGGLLLNLKSMYDRAKEVLGPSLTFSYDEIVERWLDCWHLLNLEQAARNGVVQLSAIKNAVDGISDASPDAVTVLSELDHGSKGYVDLFDYFCKDLCEDRSKFYGSEDDSQWTPKGTSSLKVLQSSTTVHALLLSRGNIPLETSLMSSKSTDGNIVAAIASDLSDLSDKIVLLGADGHDASISEDGKVWFEQAVKDGAKCIILVQASNFWPPLPIAKTKWSALSQVIPVLSICASNAQLFEGLLTPTVANVASITKSYIHTNTNLGSLFRKTSLEREEALLKPKISNTSDSVSSKSNYGHLERFRIDENPLELVGYKIAVLWGDHEWYSGRVAKYDPVKNQHFVIYEDGDKKWYTMARKEYKIVAPPPGKVEALTNSTSLEWNPVSELMGLGISENEAIEAYENSEEDVSRAITSIFAGDNMPLNFRKQTLKNKREIKPALWLCKGLFNMGVVAKRFDHETFRSVVQVKKGRASNVMSPFTMAMWIYIDESLDLEGKNGSGGSYCIVHHPSLIIRLTNNHNERKYRMVVNTAIPEGWAPDPKTDVLICKPPEFNVWTHVCLVVHGRYLKMYNNGVLSTSLRMTHHAVLTEGPLSIGGYSDSRPPRGSLFKLCMYDTALSHSEIIQDMLGNVNVLSETTPEFTSIEIKNPSMVFKGDRVRNLSNEYRNEHLIDENRSPDNKIVGAGHSLTTSVTVSAENGDSINLSYSSEPMRNIPNNNSNNRITNSIENEQLYPDAPPEAVAAHMRRLLGGSTSTSHYNSRNVSEDVFVSVSYNMEERGGIFSRGESRAMSFEDNLHEEDESAFIESLTELEFDEESISQLISEYASVYAISATAAADESELQSTLEAEASRGHPTTYAQLYSLKDIPKSFESSLQPRKKIQVKISGGSTWVPALVNKINDDGTVSVKLEDNGDKAINIHMSSIRCKTKNGWEKLSRYISWPLSAKLKYKDELVVSNRLFLLSESHKMESSLQVNYARLAMLRLLNDRVAWSSFRDSISAINLISLLRLYAFNHSAPEEMENGDLLEMFYKILGDERGYDRLLRSNNNKDIDNMDNPLLNSLIMNIFQFELEIMKNSKNDQMSYIEALISEAVAQLYRMNSKVQFVSKDNDESVSSLLFTPSIYLAFLIIDAALFYKNDLSHLIFKASYFDILVSVSQTLEGDYQLKALDLLIAFIENLDKFSPVQFSAINFENVNHLQLIFGARFVAETSRDDLQQPFVYSLYCQALATLMVELSSHTPVRLGGEAADAVELLMEVSEIIESIDDKKELPSHIYAEVTTKMYSDLEIENFSTGIDKKYIEPLMKCDDSSLDSVGWDSVLREDKKAFPSYILSTSNIASFQLRGEYSYFCSKVRLDDADVGVEGVIVRIVCDGCTKWEGSLGLNNREIIIRVQVDCVSNLDLWCEKGASNISLPNKTVWLNPYLQRTKLETLELRKSLKILMSNKIWSKQADEEIIKKLNEILGENSTSASKDEVDINFDSFKDNCPCLLDKDIIAIRARVNVLIGLNRRLVSIIGLVDISNNYSKSLGSRLSANSHLILMDTKLLLWNAELSRSAMGSFTDNIKLTLNRFIASKCKPSNVWEDSIFGQMLKQLKNLPPELLRHSPQKRLWEVDFTGEGATDAGGPYSESIALLTSDLMKEGFLPLFTRTSNGRGETGQSRECMIPIHSSVAPQHLEAYTFVGQMMGIALRSHYTLPLYFPSIIWNLLVEREPSKSDLEKIDEMCIRAMDCIRELVDGDPNMELLESFTTTLTDGVEVELCKDGLITPVTFRERFNYANLVEKARAAEVVTATNSMLVGLSSVVPLQMLKFFTSSEIEIAVCGQAQLNVRYLAKFSSIDERLIDIIEWLWEALESFTPQQQSLFLRFVWARDRLPTVSSGFGDQRFRVEYLSGDNNTLPRAHTCSFQIDLPKYNSSNILREKLLYAVENCQDYDLDGGARGFNDINELDWALGDHEETEEI